MRAHLGDDKSPKDHRRRTGETAPPGLSRRRRSRPVHERGRVGRLVGGLRDYLATAWWGLVAPRVTETAPLLIAQAVTIREGASGRGPEVLLSIRADLFGWELPGGTPEGDESAEETLCREVEEETGMLVEIESHVGDWTREGFRPHTARIFRCRAVGGAERPSHETPRVAWFPVDALPAGLLPWYVEPLREALSPGDVPVERREWQGVGAIWQTMKIDLAARWRGLP